MNTQHLLTGALLTCAALFTTGCRSTLYRAAEAGDVQTVKAELADGAEPSGKASAANLLWQIPTGIITIPVDLVRLFLPGTPGWYETGKKTERGTPEMKFDWKTLLTRKVYNYRKATAMDVATDKNHAEVITELILAGSDASDWAKNIAIAGAASKGDAETLRKLMGTACRQKADWNNVGNYKPLMLAIGNGHEECARILLENGAKFESTVTLNNQEVTCYDYAVSKGQLELYKKLGGTIIAAPVSIVGKKIIFDYSSAQISEGGYSGGSLSWGDWKKCNARTLNTLTFGKNNYVKHLGTGFVDTEGGTEREYTSWKYKKTGSRTAEVTRCGADAEGEDFYLTFDSATTGTATSRIENDYWACWERCRNIRFTIK